MEKRSWPYNQRRLEIAMGIPGDAQEGSFANATLQSTQGPFKADLNEGFLEFSIAIHIEVPPEIKGEEALADYLGSAVFGDFIHQHPEASIEIQIGPAGDGEAEYEDDEVELSR